MKVVGRVVIVKNLSSCQRAIELPQVIDKQKVFVFSICTVSRLGPGDQAGGMLLLGL